MEFFFWYLFDIARLGYSFENLAQFIGII